MPTVGKEAREADVTGKSGRGLVRRVLCVASVGAVVVSGALAFPIVPATASPIVAPALPSWFSDLGTARPEPDQLQGQLDAAYTNFMGHGGWDKAIADGCVEVISASHVAQAARALVDKDWNDLNDVFDALTTAQVTAAVLLVTRSADLLAKVAAFEAKMAAAAVGKAPELAQSLSSFTVAVAKAAVDVYEGVTYGHPDVGKNAQDSISLALKNFKGSFSTLAGVGLEAVSQGQSVLALVNDVNQLQRDSGAATNAYFAAGNRYSAHLAAYEKTMTQLSTQVRTNCPPKTTTTTKPKSTTPSSKTALPPWNNREVGAWGVGDAGRDLQTYCGPTYHPKSPLCGQSSVDWEKVCQTVDGTRYHAYKWVAPPDDRYPSGIVCVENLLKPS